MRKVFLAAALVAVALPLSPAMAREMSGETIRPTQIVSGPEDDYPAIRLLDAGAPITVYGCLSDRSWCDVSYRNDRGWVEGQDIVINYQGNRSSVMAYSDIGIVAFVIGTYWDTHYHNRPFYSDRARWQQSYTQRYRPEWGGSGPGHSGASPHRDSGHQTPQPGPMFHAPAPQPHSRAATLPHQGSHYPPQAAPAMHTTPVRHASPAAHHSAPQASGPQARPLRGEEQGHPQGHANPEHQNRG